MDLSINRKRLLLVLFLVITVVLCVPSVKAFNSQDVYDIGHSLMFGELHWFGEIGLIVALFIINFLSKYSVLITFTISVLAALEYLKHGLIWGAILMFGVALIMLVARPNN